MHYPSGSTLNQLTSMRQPDIHTSMATYNFPEQIVHCNEEPFSHELLGSLLEKIYSSSPPITGYLKIVGTDSANYFLFFFNGAPYAAGRYSGGKPINFTIRELGRHLEKTACEGVTVSLCETDPALLKSLMLFLQEEPAVKAPTSLIDLEYIVRQIGDAGGQAMIALSRENTFNFFYFWEGKGAIAHYGDLEFERPEGMTVDEEMLLYAFQPGSKVEAYIFRDMVTTEAEDANQVDRTTLFYLLTGGGLKDAGAEMSKQPVVEKTEFPRQKPRLPSVELSVESGPQQGERFTVTLPCSIGRKDCDLILNDGLISRRHAVLKIIEHKLVLEDLASTNGTQVNGENIATKRLAPNDLISIGETNLRITPA
jgi:hypothetical protein